MLLDTEDKCCDACCHLDAFNGCCPKADCNMSKRQSKILSCRFWQKNLKAIRPEWCNSHKQCEKWVNPNFLKCNELGCEYQMLKSPELPKPLIFSPHESQTEIIHYLTEYFNQLREYIKAKGI